MIFMFVIAPAFATVKRGLRINLVVRAEDLIKCARHLIYHFDPLLM